LYALCVVLPLIGYAVRSLGKIGCYGEEEEEEEKEQSG
jgi:hypothetical protein